MGPGLPLEVGFPLVLLGLRVEAPGRDVGVVAAGEGGEGERRRPGHGLQVSGVSFSPDGSQLASYSVDGVVRIWALDLDDLIEVAQGRLTRSFTEDECRQYLHAEHCPDPR